MVYLVRDARDWGFSPKCMAGSKKSYSWPSKSAVEMQTICGADEASRLTRSATSRSRLMRVRRAMPATPAPSHLTVEAWSSARDCMRLTRLPVPERVDRRSSRSDGSLRSLDVEAGGDLNRFGNIPVEKETGVEEVL